MWWPLIFYTFMSDAETARIRYHWYKEHGVCVKCGQQNAAPKRVMCWDCLENVRKRNERKREYNTRHAKELRKQRKENGLCPMCGRKPEDGYKLCETCRKKQMRRYYSRREQPGISRSEWPSYGMCYLCGEPLDTDKKLCSKCMEIEISNLPIHRNNENHVWRKEEKIHYEQWKRRSQG